MIHQLPATQATLWLRMMGRGKVQERAIDQLLALPPENRLRQQTIEHLAILQIGVVQGKDLEEDERRLIMSLSPAMMEAYEQWRQETLALGQQIGQQSEGVALVQRLLSRRVGVLPESVHSHISQLSIAQLEDLAEALLDFTTQDDLMAWLDQHEATR